MTDLREIYDKLISAVHITIYSDGQLVIKNTRVTFVELYQSKTFSQVIFGVLDFGTYYHVYPNDDIKIEVVD